MASNEFDFVMLELNKKLVEKPNEKYRIIMQTLKQIDCPYLQRKLKETCNIGFES